MELREDVTVPELGNFRWLTVGVPGQPDVSVTLMAIPGPPVFDEETRTRSRRCWRRARRRPLLRHRRHPDDIRGPQVPRRRVHAGADGAALRHRRGLPRPVGQPLPDGSDAGLGQSQRCARRVVGAPLPSAAEPAAPRRRRGESGLVARSGEVHVVLRPARPLAAPTPADRSETHERLPASPSPGAIGSGRCSAPLARSRVRPQPTYGFSTGLRSIAWP